MKISRYPINEQTRLAVLHEYAILNTPAEQQFDDITFLAAALYEVPIALVSFADETQMWVKSSFGMERVNTQKEISFCAHALSEPGELLVVPDATKDPRFQNNPLVTADNGVRFYAGAILTCPSGHPIGTICLVDGKPRELSEEKLEGLKILSRQTVALLELHKAGLEFEKIRKSKKQKLIDEVNKINRL